MKAATDDLRTLGRAFLDAGRDSRQGCLVLDIRMPGLSGLEVARAMAEDWPDGASQPVFPLLVFVTAYDAYAVAAFEAGAVDYVLKPVHTARLATAIAVEISDEWFTNRTYLTMEPSTIN